jgi:SOS-response transcriptional repressor LexA
MLTPRQAELLAFVRGYMAAHGGVAPTYREMMTALGVRSKSRVGGLVDRLVQRGYLRRLPGCRRGVEVIDIPGSGVAALRIAASRLARERGPVAAASLLIELARDLAPPPAAGGERR